MRLANRKSAVPDAGFDSKGEKLGLDCCVF